MNIWNKLKTLLAGRKNTRPRKHNARREGIALRADQQGFFLLRVNRQWILRQFRKGDGFNSTRSFANLESVHSYLALREESHAPD